MTQDTALKLAQRFAGLGQDQRAAFLRKLYEQGMTPAQLPIPPRGGQPGRAPMSYAQQRLWFLWNLEPDSNAYNMPGALRLRGALDLDCLEASLRGVMQRHEALRTTFAEDAAGEAEQRIHADLPGWELPVLDLAGTADAEARALAAARETAGLPFDLRAGPLVRARVLRLAPDHHILVVAMHHIVTDGQSMKRVIREFLDAYRARAAGQPVADAPMGLQYADYAVWQRNWMEAGEKARQLDYWTAYLQQRDHIQALPRDRPQGRAADQGLGEIDVALPADLSRRLAPLVRASGATPFMLFAAALHALLYRYGGQDEVRTGFASANRNRTEIQGAVGFFVNTHVLRSAPRGDVSLSRLLAQVRQDMLEAQAYLDIPFESLVDALAPARTLQRTPLFQVMHNHARADGGADFALPGLDVSFYALPETAAKFELVLNTSEDADGRWRASLSYAEALYDATTAHRLARDYAAIVEQFAQDPECLIACLPTPHAAERRMLMDWGAGQAGAPAFTPVHRRFEEMALRHPDAPAVASQEQTLSYAQLERLAGALAQRLRRQGAGADSLIGVAVQRSPDAVVAMLAVLKAGAAYVPLDPSYPAERLAYIVEDSGIALLLTNEETLAVLPEGLAVQPMLIGQEVAQAGHAPLPGVDAGQLAYVIYTSGSTGRPKGVAVPHGPLAMHVQAVRERYGSAAGDREFLFASISFDIAHERWLAQLTGGGCIRVEDPAGWSVEEFARRLAETGIDTLFAPPAYVRQLADAWGDARPGLRICIVGGEAWPVDAMNLVRARLPDAMLVNAYGPTETVIAPLAWTVPGVAVADCAYGPIGRPVGHRSAYVLDGDLNLAPAGIAGELYLGGLGLTRGYLRRPGLTAERFLPDPSGAPGSRMYRSGDIARWRGDGQVEYLGRSDHQVKVRGFRIELGEIEARLAALEGVRDAVVVAQEGAGGARLAAYVTQDPDARPADVGRLREQLAAALPEHMVPAAIQVLDWLPLTPNGKVDRKALPDIDTDARAYQPPRGDAEIALAGIWAQVLGLERVGRDDNFFEIGGDSILSLQIVSRARKHGWRLSPRQVFEAQTVAGLARVAGRLEEAAQEEAPEGRAPLLPVQQAFFENPPPNIHHWNQAVLLRSAQPFDAAHLRAALAGVLAHHDSLRLRYVREASGWSQHYADAEEADVLWECEARDQGELEAICQRAQRSLDIGGGPLLRAVAVRMADGSSRLLLVIHHLAVDSVSWRILLEDLDRACDALAAGRPPAPQARSTTYQRWSLRLADHAATLRARGELDYWLAQSDAREAPLPADAAGANTRRFLRQAVVKLEAGETRRLLREAPSAYRTQVNDLLLLAVGRAICRWAGRTDLLVDLEGHGREDLFADIDLSRSVGWFTAVHPLRIDPTGPRDGALKRVKEALRAVPDKGIGYGVLRWHGSPSERAALAALARPQVSFNYLGQFDSSFDADARWRPAAEDCGDLQDADAPLGHEIAVGGQVYGGELTLSLSYSDRRHDPREMEALARDCRDELRELIDHCLRSENTATPSDFPLAAVTQQDLDQSGLDLGNVENLYPLSPMQAGILFHTLAEPGAAAYVNQLRLDVTGLDADRFVQAWQAVQAEHDILRTGFLQRAGEPLQWVARHAPLPVREEDHSGAGDTLPALLDALAAQELDAGFDLAAPPLQRIALARTGPRSHHFIWTRHHLLLDGWSTSRLLGDVLRRYGGAGEAGPRGRYADYIAWLARQDEAASERFWRERLARLESPTYLGAGDAAAPGRDGYGVRVLALDAGATASLRASASRGHITLNTLVQAAWVLTLLRHTGQPSVAFGSTVSGRPAALEHAESLLGVFINTLPVIQRPDFMQPVGEWLRDLFDENVALREHEHTPLSRIQRWAGKSGEPLFDSIVVFENYPVDQALSETGGTGLAFGNIEHVDLTNFAMDLEVTAGETLRIKYTYQRARLDEARVDDVVQTMRLALDALAGDPSRRLAEAYAGLAPQPALATGAQPAPGFVHRAIREHAQGHPGAAAVQMGERTVSRGELDAMARRVAGILRDAGAGPEDRVGIALPRGPLMLGAMLGTLRAGAAYVPMDLAYPRDRLAYIMADSGMKLLLTQADCLDKLPQAPAVRLLPLDEGAAAAPLAEPDGGEAALHPENLAYLIYTSGSTGVPKGVAVAHGPLHMHCEATCRLYEMDADTRELHFLSMAFDGGHERWISTLLCGGCVILRDDALWAPEQTSAALRRHGATNAGFPPAYLQQLAQWEADADAPPPVRLYSFGGEAMPRATFELVKRALRPQLLINGYGPTEAVVTPLAWKVPASASFDGAYAPIGVPVGDRHALVLDGMLNAVPDEGVGELYIGGSGLARGYLGRPALTAERFVPDPARRDGGRLYRSGDLVRRRRDGTMEYVGRGDQQIKVRGFRIEPGEIEARLLACAGVGQAVVLARDVQGNRQLVAYIVARAGASPDPAVVRDVLKAQLPDYMVPAHIVGLDAMPLTPNGKVDRNALPAPAAPRRACTPPRTPLEAALAQIWREVLRVDEVGVDSNFFELGGDSILSLQVLSRARKLQSQGLTLKLRDLMKHQTIAELAALASSAPPEAAAAAPQAGGEAATVPLTPIQRWFFEQGTRHPSHYNLSLMLRCAQPLDAARLESALHALLARHAALRYRYEKTPEGDWTQRETPWEDARDARAGVLTVADLADRGQLETAAHTLQTGLDLSVGRVFRAGLFRLADGGQRLLLVLHHLVMDGVSWRVLLDDLLAAYGGQALPEPGTAFADWARQLAGYAVSARLEAELPYWRTLAGRSYAEPRPDRPSGANTVRHASHVKTELDASRTRLLLGESNGAYRTQINDLLLAGLARTLGRWTQAGEALIELEGHGREDIFDGLDLSRTVGWFTSEYPVVLPSAPDSAWEEAIPAVKAALAAVPDKGIGFGVLKYMGAPQVRAEMAALPRPRVTFNYLGQFDRPGGDGEAAFLLAPESSGQGRPDDDPLDNWLIVNAQAYEGRLAFTWNYSALMFDRATVERLARDYMRDLDSLIDHCRELAAGVAPSSQPDPAF